LVLDDQRAVEKYYIRCRKLGVSIVFISQSYFRISKLIRSNCSYLVILKLSGDRDMRLILTEFGLGLAKEELLAMYKHATAKKFNFLFIDLEQEAEKRFRHNFLTILDPKQFAKETLGVKVSPPPTENMVLEVSEKISPPVSPRGQPLGVPRKSLKARLDDVGELRVELLEDLTKDRLTDHENATIILSHLGDQEVRKVSQMLPRIEKELRPRFTLGVPAHAFLDHIYTL